MIAYAFTPARMNQAFAKVRRNSDCAGVDGVTPIGGFDRPRRADCGRPHSADRRRARARCGSARRAMRASCARSCSAGATAAGFLRTTGCALGTAKAA